MRKMGVYKRGYYLERHSNPKILLIDSYMLNVAWSDVNENPAISVKPPLTSFRVTIHPGFWLLSFPWGLSAGFADKI